MQSGLSASIHGAVPAAALALWPRPKPTFSGVWTMATRANAGLPSASARSDSTGPGAALLSWTSRFTRMGSASGSARLASRRRSTARSGSCVTMLTSTSRIAEDRPEDALQHARHAGDERGGVVDLGALLELAPELSLQVGHVLLELGDPRARLGLELARAPRALAAGVAEVREVGELGAEERRVETGREQRVDRRRVGRGGSRFAAVAAVVSLEGLGHGGERRDPLGVVFGDRRFYARHLACRLRRQDLADAPGHVSGVERGIEHPPAAVPAHALADRPTRSGEDRHPRGPGFREGVA